MPGKRDVSSGAGDPNSKGSSESSSGDEAEAEEVGGNVGSGIGGSGSEQLDLEDDMLVGDEEEVFTTPARLLAAVELALKEARKAGDDEAVVEELESLRGDVAERCDFLN